MPLHKNDNQPEHFRYGDYLHWPDGERWELVEGQAYAMAPAPSRLHQDVLLSIARQIADKLETSACRVYVAPFDVRLPDSNEADAWIDTVVQPDISVVCDPDKLDEAGCRGAPDWIVEILSPSTAHLDQGRKRGAYERHGVKEYWLVHPVDRIVTVYRLGDTGYGKPDIQALEGHSRSTSAGGVEIDWGLVVAPAAPQQAQTPPPRK